MAEYKSKEQKKAFYKSAAWQSLRLKVLEEQNYECQECRELGYVRINDTSKHKTLDVDHVKEIETHPELALVPSNLRVLCIQHHNAKHNRWFKRKPNKWAADERW